MPGGDSAADDAVMVPSDLLRLVTLGHVRAALKDPKTGSLGVATTIIKRFWSGLPQALLFRLVFDHGGREWEELLRWMWGHFSSDQNRRTAVGMCGLIDGVNATEGFEAATPAILEAWRERGQGRRYYYGDVEAARLDERHRCLEIAERFAGNRPASNTAQRIRDAIFARGGVAPVHEPFRSAFWREQELLGGGE